MRAPPFGTGGLDGVGAPAAGNSPFDSAIELACAEGLFGEEPFSVSALKAGE